MQTSVNFPYLLLEVSLLLWQKLIHCTEVRFATFISGGFTTMAVINPLVRKLAKRTSVQCLDLRPHYIIIAIKALMIFLNLTA